MGRFAAGKFLGRCCSDAVPTLSGGRTRIPTYGVSACPRALSGYLFSIGVLSAQGPRPSPGWGILLLPPPRLPHARLLDRHETFAAGRSATSLASALCFKSIGHRKIGRRVAGPGRVDWAFANLIRLALQHVLQG